MMTHHPPITNMTVAVATLDRPVALARCLDAIVAGTTLPAELLVVDQGSAIETHALVQRYASEDMTVRYVRQERRGLSASRNAALSLATHPIFAVTDDDCVPGPMWLQAISLAFAASDPPAAVTGPVHPLGPPQPGRYAVSSRLSDQPAIYEGVTDPWTVGTGANFAISRMWRERIGGYDERLGSGSPGGAGEDLELIYRLLRSGGQIRYEPAALISHERQTKAQHMASRTTYGRGVGAFCALWLRRRDGYPLVVLYHWVALRLVLLLSALRRGCGETAHEEMLVLTGTLRGLQYGLRASPKAVTPIAIQELPC